MRLAIMQPYFMPYIGYWQLINAVDKFVILDDVNYINKGWINRNNILVNGQAKLFTIPLSDASQNKKINEISISDDLKWSASLLKTIEYNYKKAPFYSQVFPLIQESILFRDKNLSALIYNNIKIVCTYLHIETQIIPSSSVFNNSELKSSARILDICLQEQASEYINPIGGVELYNYQIFSEYGLSLKFLQSSNVEYKQYKNEFIPLLSIIDILMFNSVTEISDLLDNFILL